MVGDVWMGGWNREEDMLRERREKSPATMGEWDRMNAHQAKLGRYDILV